jgi:hypothetical protein
MKQDLKQFTTCKELGEKEYLKQQATEKHEQMARQQRLNPINSKLLKYNSRSK